MDDEGIEGGFAPWQGLLWTPAALPALGVLRGVICTVGDLVVASSPRPQAFVVLAGVVESFVYVNIIFLPLP